MTVTIPTPPAPRAVPDLAVDPSLIRAFAGDLRAASAQVDDLGTFVTGTGRVGDWTGRAADAYHASIRPVGRQAEAVSLALRAVARRVDAHADRMTELARLQVLLAGEEGHLRDALADLQARAGHAADEDVSALLAEREDCVRRVHLHGAELDRWLTDVMAEEEAMRTALERAMTLEQVEQRYGDVADPADGALLTMPPAGSSPGDVTEWWEGLTRPQQTAIMAASPGSIGNRDGIPAWARDGANTVALDRDLAAWGVLEQTGTITSAEATWLGNARAAQEALELVGGGTDPVSGQPIPTQLYAYDPGAFGGDGAVAIAAGDLGTADNVAVVVPGFGTDAASAAYQADRVRTLYESCRYLGPGQSTAALSWIGYDAPDNAPWDGDGDWSGVLSEQAAEAGGGRLAETLDGLRAARGGEAAHLTVIGHSYGSTTTGVAAHAHGIPVDDLVFVGSPGVGGGTDVAADTGVGAGHVWAGANSRDPIAALGNHGWVHGETAFGAGLGDDPVEDDFGAHRFQAESTTRADNDGLDAVADHSKYFDHDTESLRNISLIVNGDYDAVVPAAPVHDPWLGGPEDPEWNRQPTAPATRTDP